MKWPFGTTSGFGKLVAAGALSVSMVVPQWAVANERARTLVVASPSTPQSLDNEYDVSLGTIDVLGAMYDYLVDYEKIADPNVPGVRREDTGVYEDRVGGLALEGKLAESWSISEDGTRVTFKLREGVKSHWGNELSAQDVKWTWDRKFALAAQGSFYTSVIGLESPDSVTVEGPLTVAFQLKSQNPLALKIHAILGNPIYDSTKLQEVGGSDDPWGTEFLKNNSAGFGPYKVSQVVRGQQAVLEAHDGYWGEAPYIKRVIIREIPSSASRLSLLKGGAVDIAQFLQPREYLSLQDESGITVDSVNASYMTWMILNSEVPPLDNKLVRHAINYAIPREEILEAVYYGYATKQTAPVPSIYAMADSSFFDYDYDLEAAKELLSEAGFEDGFETTISFNAGNPVQEPIATIIQSSLRKVGIDVTLEKLPAGVFYENVTKRQKPIIFYQDAPWAPDVGYGSYLFFHKDSFPNYSNYVNEDVSGMIESAMATIDDAEREPLLTEVQKQIMSDAPWAFIAYPKYVLAHKSDLKGFTYYSSNNLRFQDFYRE